MVNGRHPYSLYTLCLSLIRLDAGVYIYILTEWFLHFVKTTKPSENDPVAPVLGVYYSQIRST